MQEKLKDLENGEKEPLNVFMRRGLLERLVSIAENHELGEISTEYVEDAYKVSIYVEKTDTPQYYEECPKKEELLIDLVKLTRMYRLNSNNAVYTENDFKVTVYVEKLKETSEDV